MKSHTVQIILLTFLSTLPLSAQGPGAGRGRGAGHGPGGGPGGQGFQEAIHKLFENHKKIKRTVEMTDTGYRAVTVSEDKVIAATLKKHVKEMRERLGSGMMIRRWDPAFAELVEHYSDIDHEFKEVENGVEMIAKGKTPDAIKVVKNHAKIISGFVEKGETQMHESHPRALGGEKTAPAAKECPDCKADAAKAPATKECPDCKADAAKAPAAKP